MDFEQLDRLRRPSLQLKSWMDPEKFILAKTEDLAEIVDTCIRAGLYAIDLETTGLDNRVFNGATIDKITGVCLSPDGERGYYIPILHPKYMEHCVSISVFYAEMRRLIESGAIAIFHNAKFDQEFLQFNGSTPLGEWDDPKKWEDTMILAFLRDSRILNKGLKHLSKTELNMEMIELKELFTPEELKKGILDFGTLNPDWDTTVWYAASDAICTYRLYVHLRDAATKPLENGIPSQETIYAIEKLCVAGTRWMERNRIPIDRDRVADLIRVGQREWLPALSEVFIEVSKALGRDITPGYFRLLSGTDPRFRFDPEDIEMSIMDVVARARAEADRAHMDPEEVGPKGKPHVKTIQKRVANLLDKKQLDTVNFPLVYDVIIPDQLGLLLRELGVNGLRVTSVGSEQVKTSKDELDRVIDDAGDDFPFIRKVKRFREVAKAIGSNLRPIYEATTPQKSPDGRIKVAFEAFSTDTARFSTPARKSRDGGWSGAAEWNLHSIPSGKKLNIPECLKHVRSVIRARAGRKIYALDFSGQELRVVTNLSREPLWETEFFRCAECGHQFDRGASIPPPPAAPPPFCPTCGSDSIGDIHTLTAIALYGPDIKESPDFPSKRGDSKCVHPDTLVVVNDILRRIGELPTGDADVFLPMGPGQTVWGMAGPVPLVETYNGGTKDLCHVVTRRGLLTCSTTHRLALVDGSLRSVEEGLRPGDILLDVPPPLVRDAEYPTISFRLHEDVPPIIYQPNHDMAYFAGLFLGDGAKQGNRAVSLVHGDVSKIDGTGTPYHLWQSILSDAAAAVGFSTTLRATSVYLGSRNTMAFLYAIGLLVSRTGGRNLRVPSWVMAGGHTAITQFLAGLCDTDGSIDKNNHSANWTTKDPIFAGQIAGCLHAVGIQPRVEAMWNKKYQRHYFRIHVRAFDVPSFGVFMRHPGKVCRIKQNAANRSWNLPNEVFRILPAGEGTCVDLHVGSDDHLFWNNGLPSRNSVNFALSYGGGGQAVVRAANVTKDEGWRIKRQFDATYKGLSGWWARQIEFAKRTGYVLTAFNRRYPLPDINSSDGFFRSKAERNAVNGPVQGTGSDLMKWSMGLIYRECKKRGWLHRVLMIITIHDELVFEIDDDIASEALDVIADIMLHKSIQRMAWRVPLTCDIEAGQTWKVPWNITKIRYGKVPMPPELVDVIRVSTTTDAPKPPDQIDVPSDAPPSDESGDTMALQNPRVPHLAKGEPFVYVVHSRTFSQMTIYWLASGIQRCRGRGGNLLKLVDENGESLWDGEDIFVNAGEFSIWSNMPEV